jgi:hypothetical protein
MASGSEKRKSDIMKALPDVPREKENELARTESGKPLPGLPRKPLPSMTEVLRLVVQRDGAVTRDERGLQDPEDAEGLKRDSGRIGYIGV